MSNQTPLPGQSPTVGEYTYEEFLDAVESFHGYRAPGVVIGGVMAVSYTHLTLPTKRIV